jgi:hypothetical protein
MDCGIKVITAIVLLLLGGVIGYLVGMRCGGMAKMASCPISAPAVK